MVALNSNMQQQAFFNIDCGNEMEKIFNRNKIPLLKQKNISQMWPIISLKDIVMLWSKEYPTKPMKVEQLILFIFQTFKTHFHRRHSKTFNQ